MCLYPYLTKFVQYEMRCWSNSISAWLNLDVSSLNSGPPNVNPSS